jgi:nucleotide-binding universal stress UspA family protein
MTLRIAIPTDFSPHADKAAAFTLDLFRNRPCRFYLVHTYTPSFLRADYLLHSPGQIGLGDFYKQKVLDQLEAFKNRLVSKANPELHTFLVHAAFDNLDAELNEMASKEKLDLIAMGTQGATGAKEVLIGTNTVRVLHKSKVPVLVIPETAIADELINVLFPTDFKVDFKKLPLHVLDSILDRNGVMLHILHTYTSLDGDKKRTKNRETLQKLMSKTNVVWTDQGEQDILAALNEFGARIPVQLLVMVRNSHTFLEDILVTPVIDQIGFHTRIPFLMLPALK